MNKLIVIPESLYKSLLSSHSKRPSPPTPTPTTTAASISLKTVEDSDSGVSNAEVLEKESGKTRKDRKLSASEKNLFLNQLMSDYLSERNKSSSAAVRIPLLPDENDYHGGIMAATAAIRRRRKRQVPPIASMRKGGVPIGGPRRRGKE
jgi:hypothetical protein